MKAYIQANIESFKQEFAEVPGEDAYTVQRLARGVIANLGMGLFGIGAEKYGMPKATEQIVGIGQTVTGANVPVSRITNEFASAETEYGVLCTQTLAFSNLRPYWSLCQDVTLKSPLLIENVAADVKELWRTYLSVPYVTKAYEGLPKDPRSVSREELRTAKRLNMSARVCALRDYHRRNEVAKITAGIRSDEGAYTSEFMQEPKDDVVADPADFIGPRNPKQKDEK